MALKIYDTAEKAGVALKKDIKDDFRDFMMNITRVSEEDVKKYKEIGISFSNLIMLKLGREAKTREYVRKELETKITDLIQRLNWFIREVEIKTDKRIVVLVDDLDKLTRGQQAEDFFYKNYGLLTQPNCFIVYTFPIPLAFNPYYENVRHAFDDVKKGEQIIDILKRKDFGGSDVLIWVMPEEPNDDLLNTLNNFRELFYESKIPNLMFYNQAFSESVIRKAPDFWRYRGNYYEFKEIEGGLTFEALGALTTPLTYRDKEDLLRRKRINEYLLEKVRDKEEKSNILSELGIIFYYLGELDKALEYFKNALRIFKEMRSRIETARIFLNLGDIFALKGEKKPALDYYLEAQSLAKGSSISESISERLKILRDKENVKGG